MRDLANVGISTTSSLEGWEITEYLGPVIAHVVAGTGLFSDMFASWSDILGGRSGSYQNQLKSLSDEVVQRLRRQAAERRGNWVVGLSIDMDEISGKDKSMFMVTATGTAVVARRLSREDGSLVEAPEGRMPGAVVQSARARFELEDAIAAGADVLTGAHWETAISEGVLPMLIPALRALSRLLPDPLAKETSAALHERIRLLLERVGEPAATHALYANLGPADTAMAAVQVIAQTKRRDLGRIRDGLRQTSLRQRRGVLQTLTSEQQSYGPSDIHHLEEISLLIVDPTTFPETATDIPGKPGLFGASPQVQCECGEQYPVSYATCPRCHGDRHGFKHYQLKPAAVLDAICAEMAVLRRIFSDGADGGAVELALPTPGALMPVR